MVETLESRRLLSGADQGVHVLGLDDANELAWDPLRNRLYVSTNRGLIERYDVAAGQWLSPIDPDPRSSAPLTGLDVSAEGTWLYAGTEDFVSRGKERAFLHQVELSSGTAYTHAYPIEASEAGSQSIAVMGDGSVLIINDGRGFGTTVPVRRFHPSDGIFRLERVGTGLGINGDEVKETSLMGRSDERQHVWLSYNGPGARNILRYSAADGWETGLAGANLSVDPPAVAAGGVGAVFALGGGEAGNIALINDAYQETARGTFDLFAGGLDFGTDGFLYGTDLNGFKGDRFVQLDPATLAVHRELSLGDAASSINNKVRFGEVSPDGQFYASIVGDGVFLLEIEAFANPPYDVTYGRSGTNEQFDHHHDNALTNAALRLRDGRIAVVGVAGLDRRDLTLSVFNANGKRDDSFGEDGFVRVWGLADNTAVDLLEQADGKLIVVAKEARSNPALGIADAQVYRFHADGTVDESFGDQGRVALTEGIDQAAGATLQADGKLIIAGHGETTSATHADVFVVRLNTDGSFDAAFAAGGLFRHGNTSMYEAAVDVVVDSQQRLLVTTKDDITPSIDSYGRYRALRLLPDGTLDASFGNGGTAAVAPGDFRPVVTLADARDRLVMAGTLGLRPGVQMMRLTVDGAADETFAPDGLLDLGVLSGVGDAYARDLRPLADGGYLLAAADRPEPQQSKGLLVYKITEEGALASDFGPAETPGYVLTGFRMSGLAWQDVTTVLPDSDGRFILAGTFDEGFFARSTGFSLRGYHANGAIDGSRFIGFPSDAYNESQALILVPGNRNELRGAVSGQVAVGADGSTLFTWQPPAAESPNTAAGWGFSAAGRYQIGGNFGNGLPYTDVWSMVGRRSGGMYVLVHNYEADPYSSKNQWRLLAVEEGGGIDLSFGGAWGLILGYDTRYSNGQGHFPSVVAEDNLGRILIGMASRFTGDNSVILRRYLPDGRLDYTFGSYGSVRIPDWNLRYWPTAIQANAAGDIAVVLGEERSAADAGGPDVLHRVGRQIIRLTEDGTVLTNGPTGRAQEYAPAFGLTHLSAIAWQDRQLLLADDTQIVRLNPDGTLDSTFGDGGAVPLFEAGRALPAPYRLGSLLVTRSGHVWGNIASDSSEPASLVLRRWSAEGDTDATLASRMNAPAAETFPAGAVTLPSVRMRLLSDALVRETIDGHFVLAGRGTVGSRPTGWVTWDPMVAKVLNPDPVPATVPTVTLAPLFTGTEAEPPTLSVEVDEDVAGIAWEFGGNDGSGFRYDAYGREVALPTRLRDGPAEIPVRVMVFSDGGETVAETTVRLENTAPTLTFTKPANLWAATVLAFRGSVTDPGQDRATSWEIDWGDGTSSTYSPPPSNGYIYHSFAEPGEYTVQPWLTDEDGTFAAHPFVLQVVHRPPVADAGPDRGAPEGSILTLTGKAFGGSAELFEWDFDYIGGEFTVDATGESVDVLMPDGPLVRLAALRVTGPGGSSIDTFNLASRNVAPLVSVSGASSVLEGEPYTVTLSVTDPGNDTITSWQIRWGANENWTSYPGDQRTFTHTFPDGPASPVITIDAIDEDGTWRTEFGDAGGDLETFWGSNGKAEYHMGGAYDAVRGLTLDRFGNLLAIGSVRNIDTALLSLTPYGRPNYNFAGDGKLLFNGLEAPDLTSSDAAVVVAEDGTIWVVGRGYDQDQAKSTLRVIRVRPDGNVDFSFGTGGASDPFAFGNGNFDVVAARLDSAGRLVVAGSRFHVDDWEGYVVRINPDGTADTSFGTDGLASVASAVDDVMIEDAVLLADGGISLTGYHGLATSTAGRYFAAARLDADGQIDSGFTSPEDNFRIRLPGGTYASGEAHAIELLPDGGVLLGGYANFAPALVRLHQDGSVDDTIDTDDTRDGQFILPTTFGRIISDFATADDGYIYTSVIAGAFGTTSTRFSAFRLAPQLTVDTRWGNTGVASTWLSRQNDRAYAIQPVPGGVILAGQTSDPNAYSNWALAHFTRGQSVVVENVAPTFEVTLPQQGVAGQSVTWSVTSSDPGLDTIAQWVIQWGDGTKSTVSTPRATHTYASSGTYTVTATAHDEDGAWNVPSRTITIDAAAPTANAGSDSAVAEGRSILLSGSNSTGEIDLYEWDLDGDGEYESTGATVSLRAADGPYVQTVALRVSGPGGSDVDTLDVTIRDVSPTISLDGIGEVEEGAPYTLTFSASDPGHDPVIRWIIDWGDGVIDELPPSATSATHAFADGPAIRIPTVTLENDDGQFVRHLPGLYRKTSFGDDGAATVDIIDDHDFTFGLAAEPSGASVSLVPAEPFVSSSTPPRLGLIRFLPDGTRDLTFGIDGIVVLDDFTYEAFDTRAPELARTKLLRTSDGHFTVAETTNGILRLARFDTTGQPVEGFGAGGTALINFGNHALLQAIVEQQGKILAVAAGYDYDARLMRINADGSVDLTFGDPEHRSADGDGATAFWSLAGRLSLAVTPEEQIYVVGHQKSHDNLPVALRLDADGLPDTTFGHGLDPAEWPGRALVSVEGISPTYVTHAIAADDGRLVIAGGARTGPAGATAGPLLYRLNFDGSPDRTFGQGGGIILPGTLAEDVRLFSRPTSLLADGPDAVLLSVYSTVANFPSASGTLYPTLLLRVLADGSIDKQFGSPDLEGGLLLERGPDAGFAAIAMQRINGGDVLLGGRRAVHVGPEETDYDVDVATHRLAYKSAVQVRNVAPTFSLDAPIYDEAGGVTLRGIFADAGVADTHVILVNWGDGTTHEIPLTTASDGTGQFVLEHVYDNVESGPFTVALTLVDEDDGTQSETAEVSPKIRPAVTQVIVNGGAAQRSMVREITVAFDRPGNWPINSSMFTLTRRSGDGPAEPIQGWVLDNPGGDGITWKLRFPVEAGFAGGSLSDGVYDLVIAGRNVPAAWTFHRLFGDSNGDRHVSLADFLILRAAFGKRTGDALFNDAVDHDDDGVIGLSDFLAFRANFGKSVTY